MIAPNRMNATSDAEIDFYIIHVRCQCSRRLFLNKRAMLQTFQCLGALKDGKACLPNFVVGFCRLGADPFWRDLQKKVG